MSSYREAEQTAYSYAAEPEGRDEVSGRAVPREVDEMQELSQRLGKQVDVLRERLDPLLTPSEPTPTEATALKPARPSVSVHAAVLAGIREDFQTSLRRLQDITSRLEI